MLVVHSQWTEKIVINKNKKEGIANAYPKMSAHSSSDSINLSIFAVFQDQAPHSQSCKWNPWYTITIDEQVYVIYYHERTYLSQL